MKKALLITAYKSPAQLYRLVTAVQSPEIDCFIHIDRKVDMEPFRARMAGLKNVFFTAERYSVSLEHSSHVMAILAAARQAQSIGGYNYFISLTGQCYPLADNETICQTLNALYPAEIIDSRAAVPGTWCAGWGRWQKLETARAMVMRRLGPDGYEARIGKLARLPLNLLEMGLTLLRGRPKNNLAKLGYTYSAGSHLFILTDRAMAFILERAGGGEKKLMRIFHSISTPEESFFQTVLSASPFAKNRIQCEKHHISKTPGINRMERSDILRFICDARGDQSNLRHPLVITMAEKDLVSRSRALFARKLDETVNREIVDYIDSLRFMPPEERARLQDQPLDEAR